MNDELLHAHQWLFQVRRLLAAPLTPHLLCHTIDGNQDATSLPWDSSPESELNKMAFKIAHQLIILYSKLKLHSIIPVGEFFF